MGVAVVVAGAWAVWAQIAYSVAWTWAAVGVAAVALVAARAAIELKRFGWAFIASAVAIVAAVVLMKTARWMPASFAARMIESVC